MREALLAAIVLVAAGGSSARASKPAYAPGALKAEASAVVVGKVASFSISDRAEKDGSIRRSVVLAVAVESVEAGTGPKPGEMLYATGWTLVKEPGLDASTDRGNDLLPAPGSRARFFLEGDPKTGYALLWPNGVEGLDRTPGLVFAPVNAPTGTLAKTWSWLPLFVGFVLGVATRVVFQTAAGGRSRGDGLATPPQ